ncbi:LexA family protein [Bradyrhizobium sp. 5.13L]
MAPALPTYATLDARQSNLSVKLSRAADLLRRRVDVELEQQNQELLRAEADIQRHFRVSPPSVHQMIVTLERNGFIRRQPGVPRSIEILVPPETLPILEWLGIKTSKSLG